MSARDIVFEINSSDFDYIELKAISNAVKYAWRMKQKVAAVQFRIGQLVKFTGKYGNVVVGKVTKINSKTLNVQCEVTGTTWRVSPTLLSEA